MTRQTKLCNRTTLVGLLLAILLVVACSRNDITTDPTCRLTFSVDTLQFDTVFTTLGSSTMRLKVYNPNKQAIRTDITLEGSEKSPFRLNIDGISGQSARGVKIAAEDSLYIFVEVTIDPQNSDLPVSVADSILFETNTNRQHVRLEAYGQDVFILRDETIQSQVWQGPKPYLIYGMLVVDTLETLQIGPGVHVYLHKSADIHIKGTLIAKGETERPVVFTGDRLEEMYRNIPGQWGSIRLSTVSRDNLLQHVEIRNGTNGLMLGNPMYTHTPALTLDAVVIMNMSYSGLMAFTSDINASNCLIANCGSYTAGLFCGGTGRFVQCTVANNYSPYIRRKPNAALTVSNSFNGMEGTIPSVISFRNSIVYGTMNEELSLGEATEFSFDHCLLRTLMNTGTSAFRNVIVNTDPLFVSPTESDFHLDETSPARDAGDTTIASKVPYDLDGNSRMSDHAPDLGAYEWVPE